MRASRIWVWSTVNSSVTQSCPNLWDPMDCSMPGLPVHHHRPEFTQNSCPLSQWSHPTISSSVHSFIPSPPAFNLSQHQSLVFFFFQFNVFFLFFNFTILYWFCHISKWIHHRYTCVPHPEPSSLLPPHTILLGRPKWVSSSHQVAKVLEFQFQCQSFQWIFRTDSI